MKPQKIVELIVAWVAVILYVIIGGIILRGYELQAEVNAATDYCVQVGQFIYIYFS
jgi:hypothetical protein